MMRMKSCTSQTCIRLFSTQTISKADHRANHKLLVMDPKFYEKDFWQTRINEIDFVRSPLYDLAQMNTIEK